MSADNSAVSTVASLVEQRAAKLVVEKVGLTAATKAASRGVSLADHLAAWLDVMRAGSSVAQRAARWVYLKVEPSAGTSVASMAAM